MASTPTSAHVVHDATRPTMRHLVACVAVTIGLAVGCGGSVESDDAVSSAVTPVLGDGTAPTQPVTAPVDSSKPPGRLMFSVFDEASHAFRSTHIVDMADAEGFELRLPGPEGGGRWSNSGDQIAVMTILGDGRVGTAVVSADGTVDRVLTPPDGTLNLVCTAWSPDDRRLACEGWDDSDPSRRGIYAVNASDGGEVIRLTTPGAELVDFPGDFTRDGNRFVFKRAADEAEGTLFVVSVDGGSPAPLADGTFEDSGRVSPDGGSVATSSNGDLILLALDGVEVGRISVDGAYLFGPDWSPDGAWLGFSQAAQGSVADIVISRPDGGDARTVGAPTGNKITLDWGAPADHIAEAAP